MDLLAYLIGGAVAGVMSGLFGIGGGLVIVPMLVWLFASQGFPATTIMHFAVGSSLASIVPTSISSLLAHHRRGSVHWQAVRGLLPGLLAGALAGAWLARQVSSPVLAACFGIFEILVALHMLFDVQASAYRALPGKVGLGLAGLLIGAVSAVFGIGGGTLSVPCLRWYRIDIRTAIGSAATCGLPIAFAGAAGFALGAPQATPTGLNSGYLYWPAVLMIAITSIPGAPLGARLAHHLPRKTLQRVFALLLALIGVKMITGV